VSRRLPEASRPIPVCAGIYLGSRGLGLALINKEFAHIAKAVLPGQHQKRGLLMLSAISESFYFKPLFNS